MPETGASPRPREMVQVRPYRDLVLPDALRVPWPLLAAVMLVPAAGLLVGISVDDEVFARRLVRGAFLACAAGYATVTATDLLEHFRLEKVLTGSYLRAQAVPLGETATHVLLGCTVTFPLLLAEPLLGPLGLADAYVLASPLLFLALGAFDEVRFHRRRTLQRENILHTVNHLLAAAALSLFAVLRLVPWTAAVG